MSLQAIHPTAMLPKQTPVSEQIVDQLRAEIDSGFFRDGERFPSDRALIERFGVSPGTIGKVRATLTAYGLLVRGPGDDLIVRGPKPKQ